MPATAEMTTSMTWLVVITNDYSKYMYVILYPHGTVINV